MKKLQALLKAILLRRTKKSTVDGKPIITLPDRTTEVQHAVFSHDEHELYVALETKTQLTFNRYLKAGTVGRNYSNVLVLLLRLRQACCHPHLIKDFGMPAGGAAADVSVDDMIKLAEGLPVDVVSRIKEAGDMTNECPICMDMTANATMFTPCGHSTCRSVLKRFD
jgi:SNF2 family DNA or RNA helicase